MSNAERERIEWLVEKHQYLCDAKRMKTSKLKTILNHPGIRELLALHRADSLAAGKPTEHIDYCEQLLREWSEAELNPPPLITGHDLIRMGLEAGPLYKEILERVREAQLDGHVRNKEEAMKLVEETVREWREKNGDAPT